MVAAPFQDGFPSGCKMRIIAPRRRDMWPRARHSLLVVVTWRQATNDAPRRDLDGRGGGGASASDVARRHGAVNRLASCVAPSSSSFRARRARRPQVRGRASTSNSTSNSTSKRRLVCEPRNWLVRHHLTYRCHRFAEKETRSHYQPGTVRLRLIDNRGGGGMIIDRATAAALELLRNVM